MALVRVSLDSETYQRLLETALCERRSVPLQAEVVLRRALGLPFPYDLPSKQRGPCTEPLSGAPSANLVETETGR